MNTTIRITAARLLHGRELAVLDRPVITFRDGRIQSITHAGDSAGTAQQTEPAGEHIDYGDATLVPGLVDVHTHLVLPGDGRAAETMMAYDDEVLALQAAANARAALHAGVTTLADMGARNRVTFSLRQAQQLGLVQSPRLVLCGRPLTMTGGHLWFFNEEVDGPRAVRKAVRGLVKEGADIIKVLATGGGTAGTDPTRPSFTRKELRAVTDEARAAGKPTAVHCTSTAGIERALDARFDMLFHVHFYQPGGKLVYDSDVAKRIADAQVFVNPTLQVNHCRITALEALGDGLSEAQTQELAWRRGRYAGQLENVAKLVALGVRMVAGSDAGWGIYPFGDLVSELEQLVRVGMSPHAVLRAATITGAEALRVDHEVGSLEVGKQADLLVVDGDPLADISHLRKRNSSGPPSSFIFQPSAYL